MKLVMALVQELQDYHIIHSPSWQKSCLCILVFAFLIRNLISLREPETAHYAHKAMTFGEAAR